MSEKIKITVRDNEGKVQYMLLHDPEKTLLETMREGAVLLPSLCGGTGKCGRCMVRFCSYAPLPTVTDRSVITPDKLREGYRLACTARPKRECMVVADFAGVKAAEEGKLHVVTGYYTSEDRRQEKPDGINRIDGIDRINRISKRNGIGGINGKQAEGKYNNCKTFVAADIGTTTIAMQLVDGCSGSILDTYTCLNPQRSYGTDVIARIKAAGEGHGEKLKELVRNALALGLGQLKESAKRLGAKEPGLLCIACNTAMGHIFMGYPAESLGKSPFRPVDISMAMIKWQDMDVAILPGVSAFVGGDIVSGLYACGLLHFAFTGQEEENPKRQMDGEEREGREECEEAGVKEEENRSGPEVKVKCGVKEEGRGRKLEAEGGIEEDEAWLFLDLGTNAEMVMGTRHRMVATAAAAGPAFEGRGTDGVTGPERIHAIAKLLESGMIDATGLLAEPYFETGADVEIINQAWKKKEAREIHVTQEDIRNIQMAKAAVRAGIHFLLCKSGVKDYGRIKKVYIAGGMGFYLDRNDAVRIGLLPAALAEKAETAGNTALAGACLLGRGNWQKKGRELEHAAGGIEAFQMAELEEFADTYIRYMDFG